MTAVRTAVLLLLLAAAPADAQRFDFHRSPEKLGAVVEGADDGRFSWRAGDALSALYDSTMPSSRLRLPLGRMLTGADDFRLTVELELAAVDGGPDDFMQLAFGLTNSETTGLNRTGTVAPPPVWFVDDSDTYDQIELGYFPNLTPWGGPTLQPAVFGANLGSPFDNFAANFGPSADLGDNGPGQITEWPLGRRVRVELVHDACAQRLTTRLFDAETGEELDAGLLPIDLGFLNAAGTFTVDSFAISLYRDHADFDPASRSLFADARFLRAELDTADAPVLSWSPRALNAEANGDATLRLRGGAAAWLDAGAGTLTGPGGALVELELEARGASLAARVPRETAADGPWTLEVAGCVLPVPAPAPPPGR